MRTTSSGRALAGALAALVILAAVAPGSVADARSRPRKIEPRFMAPYRVGVRFTPNTDILSASGYAAWMIDEVLGSVTPLPKLGAAFTAAERTKGINARYFVAHALLESGWGTSAIARLKHNLFGYGAFDRNPWKFAMRFKTYEQGILKVAASIHDEYLSPTGRWWYGFTTLRAMNRYYASDIHWADKIAVLANLLDGLVVTLRERGLRFGAPMLIGSPTAGARVALDVPWTARPGAVLPPAIRFRVRWTPLAVVEAGADLPATTPGATWVPAGRTNRPGRVARLALGVPSQPGLWRLDVEALDSDGQALPASDAPQVPSLTVRVADATEATLGVSLQPDGSLAATVRSIGSAPLGGGSNGTPTVLEAWALPLDATLAAGLLSATPLGMLAPGAVRLVPLPVPAQPSVVVLRLAGDPDAVGRSLPAAALVNRDGLGHLAVTSLPVASPRDDALLGRAPQASRVALLPSTAAGTLDIAVTGGPGAPSADSAAAAMEGAPGHASLLVRSLGVDPSGGADPLSSLPQLPSQPSNPARAEVTGMAPGVRLVLAAIVPSDGTAADAATLALAWVPIAAADVPQTVAP